jgi:hypothetical protein
MHLNLLVVHLLCAGGGKRLILEQVAMNAFDEGVEVLYPVQILTLDHEPEWHCIVEQYCAL